MARRRSQLVLQAIMQAPQGDEGLDPAFHRTSNSTCSFASGVCPEYGGTAKVSLNAQVCNLWGTDEGSISETASPRVTSMITPVQSCGVASSSLEQGLMEIGVTRSGDFLNNSHKFDLTPDGSEPRTPCRVSAADQMALDWGIQVGRFRSTGDVPDSQGRSKPEQGKARRRSILKQPSACSRFPYQQVRMHSARGHVHTM